MRKSPASTGYRRALVLLAAALAVPACNSAAHRLAGTWTGHVDGPPKVDNIGDALTGMAAKIVGDIKIEFTDDGFYKDSLVWGSSTGKYTVSGDEVTLIPDDPKNQGAVFVLDGDTLNTKRHFDSDVQIQLTKVKSAD